MTKKSYTCRWAVAGQTSRANVTIMANSDHSAKQQAAKVAKELGVTNVPLTIYQGGRCVS